MEFKEYVPKRLMSPRPYLRNNMERLESKLREISRNLALLADS